MLENYIIIGFVVAVVEIIKTHKWFETKKGNYFIPILVFLIAGLANLANALVFGDVDMLTALKDGLTLGAVSGGLYSMGKTYLDKSKKIDEKK